MRRGARQRLLDHALSYPEAWEDHPWEESVAKVRKKVFVFFGAPEGGTGCWVKIPESAEAVLNEDWAEPAGYGLGKAGWVACRFDKGEDVPVELLEDLIDESYRNVAPKTLVKLLDPPAG